MFLIEEHYLPGLSTQRRNKEKNGYSSIHDWAIQGKAKMSRVY